MHSIVVLPVLEIFTKPPADFEPAICGNGHVTQIEQAVNLGSQQ
jgi:hypothetical protein